MTDQYSSKYMRSRMILFCSVVIPVVSIGTWTILSKQETSHQIERFTNAVKAAVVATDMLLETQEQVTDLTRTNAELKQERDQAAIEVFKFVEAVGAVSGEKMSQVYYTMRDKKIKAEQKIIKLRPEIKRERSQFNSSFEELQAIFFALQQSANLEITEVEAARLERLLETFKASEDKAEVYELVQTIRKQNMPDVIKAIWSNSDREKALAPDIGNLMQMVDRLANYESFEDKWANNILNEFEALGKNRIQPKLDAIAVELKRESEEVNSDQRNTVLLTALAMLASLLGAVLFIILPLTRRVSQAQAELSKSNFELQNAIVVSKNAERAKSEFLANMSHEIRTPMNGVLGMAEILGKTEMDGRQRKFVDVIIKSGNALLTIINDILDFSKIDAGQLTLEVEPFTLLEAVEDVATLLSARVSEKDIELIVRVDPNLPEMFNGDVGRFRQILTNLMGNAVKFTERGHVLVNISGEVKNGAAHLTMAVTDTGIGIPADKLKSVFQQFSQVDASSTRRHEGTGLGLAIASKLTNLMHGTITVASTVGVGTTFTASMILPVHEGAKKLDKQLPADLTGARVLVVDDNAVNREILQEQLGAWGFDSAATEGAVVAKAFLNQAMSVGIQVDCLILDYHMPEINGAMLAYDLHADPRFRNIPKILLTSVDQIDHSTLIKQGVLTAWLTKPATSKQLREAIIEAIHDARIKAGTQVTGLRELANLMRQPAAPVAVTPTASPPMQPVSAPTAVAVEAPRVHQAPAAAPIVIDHVASASDAPFILVAEDNEVNQFVVMQILEGLNLPHEIAANGRLAVESWQRRKPSLILMDVSMPEMNGLLATQKIRELEQGTGMHTPIVGLTAHALKGDEERCLAAGMDAYLTKPVSTEKLETMISKYLTSSARRVA